MASIYDKSRLKELAEQKMNDDLGKFRGNEVNEKLTLEEFERYLFLLNIIPEDDKKNWDFYLSDDVFEQIIEQGVSNSGDLIDYYHHPEYDMEMCLEEAKSMNIITGFVKLSNDLWVIKVC